MKVQVVRAAAPCVDLAGVEEGLKYAGAPVCGHF